MKVREGRRQPGKGAVKASERPVKASEVCSRRTCAYTALSLLIRASSSCKSPICCPRAANCCESCESVGWSGVRGGERRPWKEGEGGRWWEITHLREHRPPGVVGEGG